MDFEPAVDSEVANDLTRGRVTDVVDRHAVLDLRVDDADLVLEKRRQVTTRQIAVFVDRGRQHRTTVFAIPLGIVGAATEERDSKGCAADDHSGFLSSSYP